MLLLDLVSRRDPSVQRSERQQLNIIVGKNRDGETGVKVKCIADLSLGAFYPCDETRGEQLGMGMTG